jgi:spore maturation protein CgeB
MIKILFCGLKNEYGRLGAGLSFEYQNFYSVLKNMAGVNCEIFAIDEIMRGVGRDEMNNLLIHQVQEQQYDLLFCFLFTEELKKTTIKYITENTRTKTFNWFADDHWRFPIYSKYWAPLFTKVSTTDSLAVAKYKSIGVDVIKTQWGANTNLYKPLSNQQSVNQQAVDKYDITFVGKNYGKRSQYIESLKLANLPAEGYGGGWSSGRVDFEQMLKIFSHSKINLNFTESSLEWKKELVKLVVKKELGRYGFNGHRLVQNIQSLIGKFRRQIKGRTFEVPACGGFLLTGDADNLQEYYVEGKEIVAFTNFNDLIEKCRYYLAHEAERQKIAQAGYERTVKEHSYEHRFKQIFSALGLKI